MILVTGGTGFVGSTLLKQLIANGQTNIKAIKRATSSLAYFTKEQHNKIEWLETDVLDFPALQDAFNDVTHVYHCAAVISFSPKKRDWMHKVNIEGTTNIVDICLDKNIEKLVHVSSIAAIGRSEESSLVNEKTEWDETSILNTEYAKSKQRSEMEVWRGQAEGLNTVIVNPSVIMGPINWHEGTGKFFSNAWKGFPYYTTGSTGFVDVEDVAKTMITLMESNIMGERFIINGHNSPFKHVLELVADSLGKPRPTKAVGKKLSALVWRLEALKALFSNKEPLLTQETARVALESFEFDNTKIKAAIDFGFTSLESTIKRTGEAFLKAH